MVGDWKFTEHPLSGPDNFYTVRVSAFTLDTITPVILSPMPGSEVPQDFIVKWNPTVSTSSRGLSVHPGTGLKNLSPEFGVDGFFSVGLHTQLLQPPPADLSLSVSIQTFRPDPSIPSRSPSLNGQTITAKLNVDYHSLEATYQVVPEPATLIFLLGAVPLLMVRHRKSAGTDNSPALC